MRSVILASFYKGRIEECSTLVELLHILRELGEENHDVNEEFERQVDMCSLPTFGGDEPETGTSRVWSWDEDDLLVGSSWDDWEIVSREEWDAFIKEQRERGVL